jgi:hypothetical protein
VHGCPQADDPKVHAAFGAASSRTFAAIRRECGERRAMPPRTATNVRVYEHSTDRLLPVRDFLQRLFRHASLAAIVMAGSLLVGIFGYHWIAGQDWIDSFLNAAMILGGMGPVGDLNSNAAKIFAGLYALYAGLVFLVAAGILLAPLFHRVMHKFHLDDDERQAVGKRNVKH